MRIHLVRHGKPLICQDQPPESWDLDPSGVEEIESLAASGALPAEAQWFSSPEPKAMKTATRLTSASVSVVDEFKEQVRPQEWSELFAIKMHRALIGGDSAVGPGWESADQTKERILRGYYETIAQAETETIVLVGHANAWTLLASELTGRPIDLAAWERMRLPDHCVIEKGEMVNTWGDWTRAQR